MCVSNFLDEYSGWTRGSTIYLGWPNMEQRQLRVCLGVRCVGTRYVGFFARVGKATPAKTLSNKSVIPIWLGSLPEKVKVKFLC